jgi:hypothetical protein
MEPSGRMSHSTPASTVMSPNFFWTRPQVLDDLPREVLADTGNLVEPLLPGEHLDVLRARLDVLGGSPVGADAERVVVLQLEQVPHEVEAARDLEVLHGRSRPP